jgi:hypothetical protein|tara:strand:- start:4 stop:165 length:162 start_codon:yes stop_codon:yes gene_type:complete
MVLYTEEQLEKCYRIYCLKQVKQDLAFMKLDDFRYMFEDLMAIIYQPKEEEEQ